MLFLWQTWNLPAPFSFNAHTPFLWKIVHMVLGINPPRNVQYLFSEWYSWKDKRFDPFLLVGAAAILWSIWMTKFWQLSTQTFLKTLFRGIHSLLFWAQVQWYEVRQALMLDACQTLKTATMRLFASNAWPSPFRIEFWIVFVLKTLFVLMRWVVIRWSESSSMRMKPKTSFHYLKIIIQHNYIYGPYIEHAGTICWSI
jgi:hypothetical protein